MSADNRCLPGPAFHFTIPVAVRAIGCSGADHLVVSRQSMFARASIPFHDTCEQFGPAGSLVQISPLSADNRCLPGSEFHYTIPVVVPRSDTQVQITPVVSRQSVPARVGIPCHDTCSGSTLGCCGADHSVVSRQSLPAMGRNSISRYL